MLDKGMFTIFFTVKADRSWQDTGIILNKDEIAVIEYVKGRWNISPAAQYCDGNGGYYASNRRGYPLPNMREGALVGRLGEQIFLVGNRGITPMVSGEHMLQLCSNDDLEGWYGAGLRDNTGELEVKISINQR